jgi:hypothetical protein
MLMKARITRGRAAFLVALLALATAGGVAYATIPDSNGVYTACMLNGVGTIRLIDKSLPPSNRMSHCRSGRETEINWNQTGPKGEQGLPGVDGTDGPPGKDGVSVTSAPEPAGANCASGGSKFTSASGATYACNGAAGEQGPRGDPGPAGPPGPAYAGPFLSRETCPIPTDVFGISTVELSPFQNGWTDLCSGRQRTLNKVSSYWVMAEATFFNRADLAFQDNRRTVQCQLQAGGAVIDTRAVTLADAQNIEASGSNATYGSLTLEGWHDLLTDPADLNAPGDLVNVRCNVVRSGSDQSYVFADGDVRLTLLRLGGPPQSLETGVVYP